MATLRDRLVAQFDRPACYQCGPFVNVVHDLWPDELKIETPLTFIPGWMATADKKHWWNVLGLAELGRRCVSVSTPHGIPYLSVQTHMSRLAVPTMCKLAAIIQALHERRIGLTDLVAHSEGAIIALQLAVLMPERIRHIVLVNPAGLIGPDYFLRLGINFLRELYRQRKDARRDRQFNLETAKDFARNFFSAFREVVAISRTDNANLLRALCQSGKRVAVIHGVQDLAFPVTRLETVVRTAGVTRFVPVQNAGHNSLVFDHDLFNGLIDSVLDQLD